MTDTMTIVEALRVEVPRRIDEFLPHALTPGRGRCLPATRIGMEALAYFGVESKPLVTLAMAGNEAWLQWINDGGVPPMPEEAWSVGIDPRATGEGYPAHLVLRVGEAIVDLDARFFSRPAKGMTVPDTVVVPVPAPYLPLDEGGIISYVVHPDPPPFRHAGDWRRSQKEAGLLIRRMRERLATCEADETVLS